MKNPLSDLGTLRGRIFFWLGLLILPVFWVWWMRPAYFSRWQRRAGLVWTVCYMVLLFVFRVPLERSFGHLIHTYPMLAVELTLGLGVWFMFRLFRPTWEMVFMGVFALAAPLGSLISVQLSRALPTFMSAPLMVLFTFPVAVAVLHLLLVPSRRWMVIRMARGGLLWRHLRGREVTKFSLRAGPAKAQAVTAMHDQQDAAV